MQAMKEWLSDLLLSFKLKTRTLYKLSIIYTLVDDQVVLTHKSIDGIPNEKEMRRLFDESYRYYPGVNTHKNLKKVLPDIYEPSCYSVDENLPLPLLVSDAVDTEAPILGFPNDAEFIDKIRIYLKRRAKNKWYTLKVYAKDLNP